MARRKRRPRADGIATRERILGAATAMFAANGYEATSLRQIAAASEIDIATLKYHFDDKQTLFAQVYQAGHEHFLNALLPILAKFPELETREAVRDVFDDFVSVMHDFVAEHLSFVKLTLFRLIEESVDIVDLEEELQTVALDAFEQGFQVLIDRGLVADIDARALVVFLISSFSTYQVTARTRESWLGPPHIETAEGRERFERFYTASVLRILGLDDLDTTVFAPAKASGE